MYLSFYLNTISYDLIYHIYFTMLKIVMRFKKVRNSLGGEIQCDDFVINRILCMVVGGQF